MNAVAPFSLAERVPARYAPHCRPLRFGTPQLRGAGVLVPATRLAGHVDAMLAAMCGLYDGDDRRALLSQWSKFYFNLVIPPALVAARVLGRPLAMALADSTVLLRGGLPQSWWLPHGAFGEASESPALLYRSLCVDHLAPVIAVLAEAARLSPRVFWSNTANTLEYALVTEFGGARARDEAAYLFESRTFFDRDEPNPLRHAIRYVEPKNPLLDSPFRVRRVCCLRDRLPGEKLLCSACPLLLSMSDGELAEQRRLGQEEAAS